MRTLLKVAALILCSSLVISSCYTPQDLNVDFGDKTFVNDYTGLVNAINDLKSNLKDRFDALNKAIENGFNKLEISIDKNTGALTALNNTNIEGFSKINTTIFDGFKAVKDEIGNVIVAMDNNGNLLRININNLGELLNATLISSAADLKAQMQTNASDLCAKLALLETAIKSGFTTNKDGFELIKNAIGSLEDEVQKGNLSEAEALAQLKTAVGAIGTGLDLKLEAIGAALNTGLANVTEAEGLIKNAIGSLEEEVKNGNLSEAEALAQLKSAVGAIGTGLDIKIEAIKDAIVSGLADITEAEGLITSAVDAVKTAVKDGFGNETAAIGNVVTALGSNTSALNDIKNQIGTSNSDLKEALVAINGTLIKILADSGLYFDLEESGLPSRKYMYMTPEVWASIMSNEITTDIIKEVMTALDCTIPDFTAYQLKESDGCYKSESRTVLDEFKKHYTIHGKNGIINEEEMANSHLNINYNGTYGDCHLYSDMFQLKAAVANGKNVIKVYKICDYLKFEVWVKYKDCGAPIIDWLTIDGASGVKCVNDHAELEFKRYDFGSDENNMAGIGTKQEVTEAKKYGHVEFLIPCYYRDIITGEVKVIFNTTFWVGGKK